MEKKSSLYWLLRGTCSDLALKLQLALLELQWFFLLHSAAAWTPSPLPLEHQGVMCTCESLLAVQVYGLPHSTLGRPLVWPLLFGQNLSSWVRGVATNRKWFFYFALVTKAIEPCDFALVSLEMSMFACAIAFNLLPSNLTAVALWDWSGRTQGPQLLLAWIIDCD